MTVKEYLSNIPTDEITERLKYLDSVLMELHRHGYYLVCNLEDIEIIDGKVMLSSFKDKVDYLDSGIKNKADKWDIVELCSIGICAYNHFSHFSSSKDFIKNSIINGFKEMVMNERFPKYMQEYYIDVFQAVSSYYNNNENEDELDSINYFNNFVDKYYSEEISGNTRGNVKVKANSYARLFSDDNEAAYARVLLLPSILVLVYLIVLVIYFIFFR